MKKSKKMKGFTGFLLGLSLFLTCLCVYGWIQVGEYADHLELTLQSNTQNNSEETDNPPETSTPQEEIQILLDVDEYPEFRDLSLEVAQKYAKFTSGDLNFSEIKGYFQENSDILTALESYSSRRVDDHDTVLVENLVFHTLHDLGDETFLARVTFDYLVTVDELTLEYPSDYSIYFHKTSQKITGLAMN